MCGRGCVSCLLYTLTVWHDVLVIYNVVSVCIQCAGVSEQSTFWSVSEDGTVKLSGLRRSMASMHNLCWNQAEGSTWPFLLHGWEHLLASSRGLGTGSLWLLVWGWGEWCCVRDSLWLHGILAGVLNIHHRFLLKFRDTTSTDSGQGSS